MIVARRFIAGVRDPMACVPEGRLNSEHGGWNFSPRTYPGRRIGSNPDPTSSLQASLRDADPMDSPPGDKSPGYYRMSLRDEGKTPQALGAVSETGARHVHWKL
jgi:hypothetical protein